MSWPTYALGQLCDIQIGRTPSRSRSDYWRDGIYPWVSISDLRDRVVSSTKEKISELGVRESGARLVKAGTVLMSFKLTIGKLAFAGCDLFTNEAIAALSPKDDRLSREFLFRALEQINFEGEGNRAVMGMTLNKASLALLQIPLPPLDEQKRIAAILDKTDQLRQKRRQAIALLDSLTQSVFLEMFGDPISNPRGFPHVPLSDLIDPKDRLNYGVVQPGDTLEGGVPLIRVSDLRNGAVDRSALKHIDPRISSKHSKSVLNGREILVSCVGSIGEIAVASDADRGSNVARAVARIPLKNGVSRAFVAAYLRTDAVQNYFTKELRTVSQPTLNIKQISETLIPLVAPEETNRFEDKLSRHQKLKKTQDLQLHETEALFHSLQNRAFSGQL